MFQVKKRGGWKKKNPMLGRQRMFYIFKILMDNGKHDGLTTLQVAQSSVKISGRESIDFEHEKLLTGAGLYQLKKWGYLKRRKKIWYFDWNNIQNTRLVKNKVPGAINRVDWKWSQLQENAVERGWIVNEI